MSAHYYKWAWAQSLPALEKMVLFNLVERSDEEGSSYPSIARIALDTGMNEKTAGAAILSLEKAGLIHVTRRHGHSSTYQLKTEAQAITTPKTGVPPKQGYPHKRRSTTTELGGPTTPELGGQNPAVNPAITPQEGTGAKSANDPPAITQPPPSAKSRKRSRPKDFAISDAVRRWAEHKGYADLEVHFENFCEKADARGYQYVDWDAALRTAIREDWAGLRQSPSHRNPSGDRRHATHQRPLSAVERVSQTASEWLEERQQRTIIDLNEYRSA